MAENVDDLDSAVAYIGPPARTSADLAGSLVARRPRTRWLKSEDPFSAGNDVPSPILWQWNAFKTVDADFAWTRWWKTTTHRKLWLAFATTDLSGDNVNVRSSGADLHVSATSRAAARLYRNPHEPPADELHEALIEQLRTTMSTVARHLNMPTPPALPNLTSAGHLLRQ